MALPLGKITLIVGAGLIGSVLAKEGQGSGVSDFFSGALKLVFKQLKSDDVKTSRVKPPNDSLLQQVNSLRQELQLLASNRPITIVTSTGSGGTKYGAVVVVLVVGYGYVWWKGWKLPNLMFATRRSLSEATTKIAKELENVYSSISSTKRHLSSKIDRVDTGLDEAAKLTDATRGEVSELRGDLKVVGGDVRSVRHAVQTLETKLNRIEGKQNYTVENVVKLVDFAWTLENGRTKEQTQAIASTPSRPAIELPETTAPSRSGSSTPTLSLELPSPSASFESQKSKRPLSSAVSGSGLKDLHESMPGSPAITNGVDVTEDTNQINSSSSVFGRLHSGFTSAFISRTRSAMPSLK